jgi:CheY-like chemotaxis protein
MAHKVLVADDSRTSRLFIIQALEMAGLAGSTFLEAADGDEALARVEASPDLTYLVTDLNMPERTGKSLIEEIRRRGLNPRMVVMVVSSTQSAARDAELRQLGVEVVLQKPIQMAKLVAALAAAKKGA